MEKKHDEKQISPVLQYLVLCDNVLPDKNNKISLVGIFDRFLQPTVIPHFCIAMRWKKGVGSHKFCVKLLDPDLKEIFTTPNIDLTLRHETDSASVVLNIDGMNFNRSGVYWVEVFLNNETIQSIPIPVDEKKI